MKILWTANLIPKEASEHLNISSNVLGGWVESMAKRLRNFPDLKLTIACKTDINKEFNVDISGIKYISINYNNKTSITNLKDKCEKIIEEIKPDIIQVEGTEFLHSKAMLDSGNRKHIPTIVSLQGILNGQYQYQCGQMQIDDMMFSPSFNLIFTGWILHLRKTRWFKPRMKTERETIQKARYLMGRTTWDRAHSYAINPKAKYFSCNRILRDPFYKKNWNIKNIERHSIYIGNGYYALKGLQYVIRALPFLLKEYSDIKVYVAGTKPFVNNDNRPFYKRGYGLYLEKLINDLNVKDHIIFTGPLKADEVATKLSKVHVYVLCSAIENSPNTLGEAMCIGTPCIASYVGGVSDMAEDNKDALFYRNDDSVLLAWNIKRIFDKDDLALYLSENGKQKARLTHNPDKNAMVLYNIYKEILNN